MRRTFRRPSPEPCAGETGPSATEIAARCTERHSWAALPPLYLGEVLCHTAVIARELGIPAVVGVADALVSIPDGATVTVDPVEGTVSIVRP